MHLIEFARFAHDGRVTKIKTGNVRNVCIYVHYHVPLALQTMARAGYRLGLDCPDGWKKAACQQARLPLVLGVPAISPCISPTMVNIRVYVAYRTSSNFSNMSIMCKSREFN